MSTYQEQCINLLNHYNRNPTPSCFQKTYQNYWLDLNSKMWSFLSHTNCIPHRAHWSFWEGILFWGQGLKGLSFSLHPFRAKLLENNVCKHQLLPHISLLYSQQTGFHIHSNTESNFFKVTHNPVIAKSSEYILVLLLFNLNSVDTAFDFLSLLGVTKEIYYSGVPAMATTLCSCSKLP